MQIIHNKSNHLLPPLRRPSDTLQHLADNLGRFLVRLEQLLALLPLGLDRVVLVQQLLEQVFFIQLADEPVLHHVFRVVDQQVHDGLGDLVGDGLAHDVEVGGDEAADELCLEGLALGEGRGGFGFRLGDVSFVCWISGG